MASSGPPPNYYVILEIQESATTQQVRDAYKKAALKTHPDRVPSDSPERASRTRKFQIVNDAYYTLSDPSRRREYDAQRKIFGTSSGRKAPAAGADPGGALGFIVANVPGLLAGAVAGNRLGAIRDTKGKSVYAVFQDLPQADRARLLTQLAAKVFSHTVGV
ncbi:hypothetical protein VdG1_01177 [Verticillium dahliae VDG1]|nr:hypothetical protein VdG1_01177 [Verticillium dahliae VDG1]